MKKISYLLFLIRAVFYKALNRHKYKYLGFKTFVIDPLRINGGKYIAIGDNTVINTNSWLYAEKIDDNIPELVFEDGCVIGDFNHIAAVRKVVFGKNVLTANGVYVSDNLHDYRRTDIPIMKQPILFKSEVCIGEGSWLGENVCVIGAKIGRNCVVGANSVVTKDIPDYCVAVGSPAKVIKKYNMSKKVWEKTN